jgi:hypothetical protein
MQKTGGKTDSKIPQKRKRKRKTDKTSNENQINQTKGSRNFPKLEKSSARMLVGRPIKITTKLRGARQLKN